MPDQVLDVASFLGGYVVILLTPGPNMLSVAGIASVGGLRAALPLCVGLALGAGSLCSAVMVAAEADATSNSLARIVGAVLLVWVAIGMVRRRASPVPRARAVTVFATGFAAAALSPLSGAYFLSASLTTGRIATSIFAAPALVAATALLFFITVATALANPAARRAAVRWDRHVRLTAAVMLAITALRTAWPVLGI